MKLRLLKKLNIYHLLILLNLKNLKKMGYNFILSESEKKEILNKHSSYKNFLNEESVTPSILDIQLKLVTLGFAELLGPTKADGKFGKNTCNAILSALTSLKQKRGSETNEVLPAPINGTPKVETPKVETPKVGTTTGDGKIEGKLNPLGNEKGDAGIDVT